MKSATKTDRRYFGILIVAAVIISIPVIAQESLLPEGYEENVTAPPPPPQSSEEEALPLRLRYLRYLLRYRLRYWANRAQVLIWILAA